MLTVSSPALAQERDVAAEFKAAKGSLTQQLRDKKKENRLAAVGKIEGFATPEAARLLCFRPSLPMLLLKGPKGYALNLASAPAKTAGLYIAGYALLIVCLTR